MSIRHIPLDVQLPRAPRCVMPGPWLQPLLTEDGFTDIDAQSLAGEPAAGE